MRAAIGQLLNEFGERQWQSGRGVPHKSLEEAFDAIIERAALAAPAQPVTWQVNLIADHVADNWPMRKYDLAEIEQRLRGIPAAPQPAAQAAAVDATVQEDAERWQFFAEYLVGTRMDLDDEIVGCDSVQKMAKVLDAAIAAQKGGAA